MTGGKPSPLSRSPYDEQIAASEGDTKSVFLELAMRDVTDACDLLRPVWEGTRGARRLRLNQVDPNLASDTEATIAQATYFHDVISRPNLLVKIPAADAGVPAIEEMTARGYSINVTLIFSLTRHRQVAKAYLRGLERLVASAGDQSHIHWVASFFVSRVDTKNRPPPRRNAVGATSRGASASPTPSSPTSNTRSCSTANAGTTSPLAARPRSAGCGPRPR